jgi:hypothetical protein
MPTGVDRLTKESSQGQIDAAISDCIAYHMDVEGITQEQAAGKCYGMARNKTGKELGGE